MTTVKDTAHDLILSICVSFDQARFYSRFVVKLFIQKPFSFKRYITEKIEIRKNFQISDLDSNGYSRVLRKWVRWFVIFILNFLSYIALQLLK